MAESMDRGHVDRITRQFITGWAADELNPDRRVMVSVFVNGHKIAQFTCDQPRSDLRQTGLYGEGLHGFRYEFSPPIARMAHARVAVRFADSGRPLGNGEALLKGGGDEASITPSPPFKQEQFIVPAPVDSRSLFKIFSLYEPANGLYPLLCRLDFSHTRQNYIDFSVFGEIPEARQRGSAWNPQLARDYLNDLLHSPRFQQNILTYVLRAFPEKRRLLFVHIPKCAGSDLSMHLASRFPSLEQRLMEEGWTEKDQLFHALAEFVRELVFSDSIFLRGHIPLDFYTDAGLIRPADRVFTIVRDPIEIAISQINYVLTKFQLNIESGILERDTENWLRLLGLRALPAEITPQFVADYTRKMLYNPDIVESNSICRWLGGGDAKEVVDRLARHLAEVTDTAHYNEWFASEWGISARTRQNESTKYVSLAALGHQELAHLRTLSPEDIKLYTWIQTALTTAERPWITGEELISAL